MSTQNLKCPNCDSECVRSKGYRTRAADSSKFKRYQCQNCGKYFQEDYARGPYSKESLEELTREIKFS